MAEGSNIHILGKAVFSPTNATLGRLVNAGVSSTLLLQGGLVPSYSTTFADYRYSAMYIARRTWLTDPALIVYGQASVTVLNNSNIMLALGTRLNGTLVVLKNATVELNGLGLCTSKAVVLHRCSCRRTHGYGAEGGCILARHTSAHGPQLHHVYGMHDQRPWHSSRRRYSESGVHHSVPDQLAQVVNITFQALWTFSCASQAAPQDKYSTYSI
jgi:hypothetical protein